MGNWKELGEVSDSDDDGVDSQEFVDSDEPNRLTSKPFAEQTGRTSHGADDDVWSIPKSPPERRTASPRLDDSSRPDTKLFAATVTRNQLGKSNDVPNSRPGQSMTNHLDLGIIRKVETPGRELLSDTEDELALSAPPFGDRSNPTPSHGPTTSRLQGITISSPSQADFRPGRSLRPRIPIQEHPYLLEYAQYSSILKSHGIKPIRLATPASRPGDGTEEQDSQEQEFTAEESQVDLDRSDGRGSSRSENAAAGDSTSMSDDDEGLELLDAVALSTSPKTSPPHLAAIVTSSQGSLTDQTDGTSNSTDDEHPSLGDLISRPHKGRGFPTTKRTRFPKPTTTAKRSDPTSLQWRSRSSSPPIQEPTRASLSQESSPATKLPVNSRHQGLRIDRLLADDEDTEASSSVESVSGVSASGSENEAENKQKTKKRMKGVLPASWLRLDRPRARGGVRKSSHRQSPAQSPERGPRKGLALPKQSNPAVSTARLLAEFSDDDSGDDVDEWYGLSPTIERPEFPRTAASSVPPRQRFDDDLSAEEEDVIDRMTTGTKRKVSFQGPRRRKKRKDGHGVRLVPDQTPRQPRITSVLSRPSNVQSPSHGSSSENLTKAGRARGQRHIADGGKTTKPHLLSILDFIDAGAPQFLRNTTKTTKKSSRLGKSSPTRKVINLGNRKDNIDVLTVLQDWRSGKLQPSAPSRQIHRIPAMKRTPLRPLSSNSAPKSSIPEAQLLPRSQL